MKEYRCTRNTPYTHECLGKHDISARQGYYIAAINESDAIAQMEQRFPSNSEGFTIEFRQIIEAQFQ